MARKRRAVERASVRQTIADRIVAGLLVILAASGLMSVLPGQSQAAVSRFACRVGSLGLGTCQASALDLGTEQLNEPRCGVLANLDQTLPEVRVKNIVTASGIAVQVDSARSGDAYVQVGAMDGSEPPFLLAGEVRGSRTLIPGVELPSQTEWFLPGGQGADTIVEAVDDRHREWVQRRSSLAVVSALLDRGGRDVPEPTTLVSRIQLDDNVLPHITAPAPAPPRRVPLSPGEQRRSQTSWVAVTPRQPALLEFNRITRETSVVAPLDGTFDRLPISGSVRWTRDSTGAVTSVVLGLVSTGRLAAKETLMAGRPTGIAYVSVPVRTATERNLAAAWLSDRAGFTLGLDALLGLRAPDPKDQLTSFLTKAATVTVLRYSGVDARGADDRVRHELTSRRRVEAPGVRLVMASEVSPQPSGIVRVLGAAPTCAAP